LAEKTGGVAAARAQMAQALSKLIEVFFGLGRRAVRLPRWPAALRLAEELDGRKPPEVAPAAELLREQRSGAKGVSQRNPEVG
jgi:hypothetical protein